ncbi:MAG TPA: hypothetical protein VMW10_12525 [Alphaproteobacteria bacterium]|nr:hypothetical protein [Alphaproteobacteria bacterium]
MFLKNIFQIYTLFVCLICTVVLIVTTGFIINGITDLIIPEYKNYSSLSHYRSNESYTNYIEGRYMADKELQRLKDLSPAQIEEKRVIARKEFLEERKGAAIQSLISSFEWSLVALFFFFVHWRLYRRSKDV